MLPGRVLRRSNTQQEDLSMATKKAKTAQKNVDDTKAKCPDCGKADTRVVRYVGFGPKGLFWVCDNNCGYMQRTR